MITNGTLAKYLQGIKNSLRDNKPVKAFEEVDALEEYLAQCKITLTSGSYRTPSVDVSSRESDNEN